MIQPRNLPRIGQRCLEMENGKEKLRCRGQNEDVKYIAVGETEGESRADGGSMKRKRWWSFWKRENLLQEKHFVECAGRSLEAWGTNGQDAVHRGLQTPPQQVGTPCLQSGPRRGITSATGTLDKVNAFLMLLREKQEMCLQLPGAERLCRGPAFGHTVLGAYGT